MKNQNTFYISFSTVLIFSLLSSVLLVLGGNDPLGTLPSREFYYTFLAFLTGLCSLTIIGLNTVLDQTKTRSIFFIALIVRLISIQAWPLLEDDYFRYLWDGRETALELSPWKQAPAEFFYDESLTAHWHHILSGINNPELPTLYGPVLQYLFGLAYFIKRGELWPIQSLLLLIDLGILTTLLCLGVNKRWLLVFSVHPLILKESMASSHPDSVMVLFILLALLTWKNNAAFRTGCLLGLAIASKISALLIIPFFIFRYSSLSKLSKCLDNDKASTLFKKTTLLTKIVFIDHVWICNIILGIIASIFLLYLPFLSNTGNELTSLLTFGQEWRFNPLIFKFLDQIPLLENPRLFSGLIVILGIIVLLYHWLKNVNKKSKPAYPPIDLAFFLLLIMSPVVNSWYWLWVLPFAILHNRSWLIISCCFGFLAYINSNVFYGEAWFDVFKTETLFEVPILITFAQLALIAISYIVLSRHQQK